MLPAIKNAHFSARCHVQKMENSDVQISGLNLVKKWFYGAAYDNYFLEVL